MWLSRTLLHLIISKLADANASLFRRVWQRPCGLASAQMPSASPPLHLAPIVSSLPAPRSSPAACVMHDRLVLLGGLSPTDEEGGRYSFSVLVYEAHAPQWRPLCRMNYSRFACSAVCFQEHMLAIGGV